MLIGFSGGRQERHAQAHRRAARRPTRATCWSTASGSTSSSPTGWRMLRRGDRLRVPVRRALRLDDRGARTSGSAGAPGLAPRRDRAAGRPRAWRWWSSPRRTERFPAELSGGMRKRVGHRARNRAEAALHSVRRADDRARPGHLGGDRRPDGAHAGSRRHRPGRHPRHAQRLHVGDRIAMLYEGTLRTVGTVDEIQATDDPVVRQFIEGRARMRRNVASSRSASPSSAALPVVIAGGALARRPRPARAEVAEHRALPQGRRPEGRAPGDAARREGRPGQGDPPRRR